MPSRRVVIASLSLALLIGTARAQITRQERVIAGGPADSMEGRYLYLKGSNEEIGRALAEIGRDRYQVKLERSSDPLRTRATRHYIEKNYPILYERMRGVAAALNCEADILYERGNHPTVNDPAMCPLVRGAASSVVGESNVRTDVRTMGGEDFSAFLERLPGVFIAIGSRNEARGLTFDHHHPRFDVDEQSLRIGAEVLLETTRRFLGQ